MKKMVIWTVTCIFLLSFMLGLFSACGKTGSRSVVKDRAENIIATINKDGSIEYSDNNCFSYVDIAIKETSDVISEKYDCSSDDALKKLSTGGYSVFTNMDSEILSSVSSGMDYFKNSSDYSAVVITDVSGAILASFSYSNVDSGINYALFKSAPGSSFKPLSVYAPSIEYNVINYSSLVFDSPVKKAINESGTMSDWPSNASGKYKNSEVTVADAVKFSLNTIAVKTLEKLTVEKSLNFLENNLGMDLQEEKEIYEDKGAEEIEGNLGLGYLKGGVTPKEMAGYYQIFANGGQYVKPYAVTKVEFGKDAIYTNTKKAKAVISAGTAQVMNRLLNLVVSKNGTGEKAAIENVDVCGKTGTTTGNETNWFVGFTPEYVCSVFMGNESSANSGRSNSCPEVFSEIFRNITLDTAKSYPACDEVIAEKYCDRSGCIATENCLDSTIGYYKSDDVPGTCEECY